MTHVERFARRKAIADAVRDGCPASEVAVDFGVSLHLVWSACKQFGVIRTMATRLHLCNKVKRFDVLAAVLNTDETYAVIGKRLGLKVQSVAFIVKEARAAGIRVRGKVGSDAASLRKKKVGL